MNRYQVAFASGPTSGECFTVHAADERDAATKAINLLSSGCRLGCCPIDFDFARRTTDSVGLVLWVSADADDGISVRVTLLGAL